MDRRTFLRTTAVAGGAGMALSIGNPGADSAAYADTGVTKIDLGPATLACSTLNGGFVGDKPYIVSHLLTPTRLGVFDAAAGRADSLTEIPTGGGAWAGLVDGTTIYIGTHTVADVYAFDTVKGALNRIGRVPGATYIWDMCQVDGKIYLGTYPDGKVWELDLASGALRDLGVAVPGQTYVRSIVADATTIYAGVGSRARLVALDRSGGAPRDITPPELVEESFVYQLTQTATHVIAGTHGSGLIAIIDKSDPSSYRVVHPEGVITIGKMAAAGEGEVYFGAGDSLWHLDLDGGITRKVGVTAAGDFVTAVHIKNGKVVVFTNSATMWTYDPVSGAMNMADFQTMGMPTAPELPQSVAGHDGRRVYVGGHGGVELHDLANPGATTRIRLAGETKAMTTVGRHVYMATYPSGSIVRHDTKTGRTKVLAVIGNEQNRPGDTAYDARRRLLLVGSSPDYGKVGGALSIFNLDTHQLQVYRNVVEGHAIVSTATHVGRGRAYAGSERPTGSTASAAIAVLDSTSGRKYAEIVPVPNAASISSLVVVGEVLYGATNKGVLFAVDTGTGAVLATTTVATARVDLVVAGQRLYAVSHQRLLRITPRTLAVEVVVDGLATDPTSFPMLSYDKHNGALYTITGRNLLKVTVGS